MSKCGKGCMPECQYFTTGGCMSPFNCPYKIETGYINSATSTPHITSMTNEEMIENLKCVIADISVQCNQLKTENAELREKLSNSIDTEQIAKYLAERLDCPCNFSPIDEEMFEFCRERECNSDESRVCWERVIARLKEIKEKKDD